VVTPDQFGESADWSSLYPSEASCLRLYSSSTLSMLKIFIYFCFFYRAFFTSKKYIAYRVKYLITGILLRIQTSGHREYLMGSTVNNLVKSWVYKLSCLKSDPSIQKSKILKYRALIAVKRENTFRWMIPARRSGWYRKKTGSNSRLSMESN
jgi:hypothetical protein